MRTALRILAAAALSFVPVLAACGDSGGTGTGGSGTGGSGAGASGTGGAATGGSGTGGSGTGGGAACGGIVGATCGADEWCDFPDDQCGAADGQGTCVPRPIACTDEVDPRCGCDGTVYSNACAGQGAGVDVSTLGACTPPTDTFACGPMFCATGEVCNEAFNDVPPPFAYYGCAAAPAACTGLPTTCDCAGDLATTCGGTCTDAAGGGVTITCAGG